jgi:hypothetical protein
MMMLTKTVKKLWKGQYLSIRTYEAEDAIKRGGLRLCYLDKQMILYPQEIEALKPTGGMMKSKTGGKDYQLIDIKFDSNKPSNDFQTMLPF